MQREVAIPRAIPRVFRQGLGLAQGLLLYRPDSHDTVAYQLELHAAAQPEHPFLRFEDQCFTYAQANAQINRHAYAYKLMGIKKGEVVALVMENRPEFIFHMLALHKLGAVSSLINSHGTGEVLLHAIRICEPKRIVVGSELWANFEPIRGELGPLARAVDVDMDRTQRIEVDAPVFQDRLARAGDANPPESGRHRLGDQAAFIYTSGTTGMPKAAKIMHHRMYRAGRVWWTLAMRYGRDDVLYNCLPLYHSNATLLALSSVISAGVTLALARRFSRRHFWDDCRRHGCTGFIYIGELCRYLMHSPPSDDDRDHKVRVITGNGLRPDIWRDFQQRFGIDRVAEFYGSTEGNCITVNFRGVPGSVGPLVPGMALARFDEDAQDFVRDRRGMLVRARPGQPGVLLGRIRARQEFEGYHDEAASEAKVLRDVFEKGDAYFDTGDLLRADWQRNLFFVDRLGDTFRWKGENVATSEVQEQLSSWAPLREANVYGVRIPGTDGRAGMAALRLAEGEDFDPAAFKAHVDATLPSYARPLFVRIQGHMETTSTLKLKKVELQKQGYDPGVVGEPLYFRRPDMDAYVPIDVTLLREINEGFYPL